MDFSTKLQANYPIKYFPVFTFESVILKHKNSQEKKTACSITTTSLQCFTVQEDVHVLNAINAEDVLINEINNESNMKMTKFFELSFDVFETFFSKTHFILCVSPLFPLGKKVNRLLQIF